MVVDVCLVDMGADHKSVLPFRETHSQFIADSIGFLWRNLSGLERLPDVVSDHVAPPLIAPRDKLVFFLGEKELIIRSSLSRVFSYKKYFHNILHCGKIFVIIG